MEIRGLRNFITEVNDPDSKIMPSDRIQLELVKIKQYFIKNKNSAYDRKKYIAKLCFISMAGYQVTFGFPQIVELVRAHKASEQRIGWMAAVVLCGNDPDLIQDLIPEMKKQLQRRKKKELRLALVLSAIGCIGGPILADQLGPNVADLAISPESKEIVRKRALLCLSRLYQNTQNLPAIDRVSPKLGSLLKNTSFSIRLATASLVLTIMESLPSSLSGIFTIAVEVLSELFVTNSYQKTDLYDGFPAPFLCVKLFRLLSYRKEWPLEEITQVECIMMQIMSKEPSTYKKDMKYTYFMVFAEIAHLVSTASFSNEAIQAVVKHLMSHINSDVSNLKRVALEKLSAIIQSNPSSAMYIQSSLDPLFNMIRCRDPSIDKRALQLLYVIANKENGLQIVNSLLAYLPDAPVYLKESLCMKISVLTQSYKNDPMSCVSILIQVLSAGDEYCGDKIWMDAAQSVGCHNQIQNEITLKLIEMITKSVKPHNSVLMLAAFLIGEYGHNCQIDPMTLHILLIQKFHGASSLAQSMIITSLMKLSVYYKQLQADTVEFFTKNRGSLNTEVSQRCKEYLKILSMPDFVAKKIFTTKGVIPIIVDNIFKSKPEPQIPVIETHQEEDPLQKFLETDMGEVYWGKNVTVRCATQYDQPRMTLHVNFENISGSAVMITDFIIESDDRLKFRFTEFNPVIEPQQRLNVPIQFVMMEMTDVLPKLTVKINSEPIEVTLPVMYARWIEHVEVDKQTYTQRWVAIDQENNQSVVQLVVPDGDVMQSTKELLKTFFGLTPLEIDVPSNIIAACGIFRCYNETIGILMRFFYVEENLDLSLEIRATNSNAVQLMSERAHKAFRI